MLEHGRAGDGAAEPEGVEGLVQRAGRLDREGARGPHPLPEGLERQRGEARGEDLEVEVEAQPARGEGVEDRLPPDPGAAELDERVRGAGRERDEADVERAVTRPLEERLPREDLGGRLLEVVEDALAALVEAEDAVPRALLERGGLGEAEDGPPVLGHAVRVEPDDRVPRGDDDLAAPPGVLEEEAQLRVEHDRGDERARGEGQGREELALRRVGGEPAALPAGVDHQDALRGEGGPAVASARLEQPLEGHERASPGPDPPPRRVGHDLERDLAGVEALVAPPLDQAAEGPRLPLRGGRDEDGVEESHPSPRERSAGPAPSARRRRRP